MSTEIATEFGDNYQEDYRKIVSKWTKKLSISGKITPETRSEWGLDLQESLGEQVMEGLNQNTLSKWEKAGTLPSKETIKMFSKIATKGALAVDTGDLLQRLKNSSTATIEFTASNNIASYSYYTSDAGTIIEMPTTSNTTLGEITFYPSTSTEFAVAAPPELVKRAAQTVSQIFDMAQDRFNNLMGKQFRKTGQSTGNRRWVTVTSKTGGLSRHASLDGAVRSEGETFSIGGENVYGPRPPGGDPAQWSNCSCYTVHQVGKEWV